MNPDELDSADLELLDESLLRAFLDRQGPTAPPPGLVGALHAALPLGRSRARGQGAARTEAIRPTALEGAAWAVKGPLMAVESWSVAPYGIQPAWHGVTTLAFALGPLRPEAHPKTEPRKSKHWIWRQASRLWR